MCSGLRREIRIALANWGFSTRFGCVTTERPVKVAFVPVFAGGAFIFISFIEMKDFA